MKKLFLILGLGIFFIFASIFLAFSQEEKITITTYYPSPYGSYNQLSTNLFRHVPMNTTSRPACTAAIEGTSYYDQDQKTILFCDGTDWAGLVGEAPAVTGFDVGGYTKALIETTSGTSGNANINAYLWFTNSSPLTFSSSELLKYGNYTRAKVMNTGTQTNAAVYINYRNFPRGDYSLNWEGDIYLDQGIWVTGIKRTGVTPNIILEPGNPEYEAAKEYIWPSLFHTPLRAQAFFQIYTSDGWKNADYSENFYDENVEDFCSDITQAGSDQPCSKDRVDRSWGVTYPKGSATSDVWRYYRLVVYKEGRKGLSKSFNFFYDPDGDTGPLPPQKRYYIISYDVPLRVRLENFKLVSHRESS
jgi:hypothetical protein